MNRLLLILSFILCCNLLNAQDTLVKTEPPKAASVKYTEADIHVDSDTIEAKTFQKNFKKKYKDNDFVYEQKIPEKNWWDYFKEWLADILNSIFTFQNPEASLNFVALLLKVLAILIVVFVIYLIVRALIGKEGKWIFSKEAKQKVIHYSDIEKNIHLLDFEKLIKESIEAGKKNCHSILLSVVIESNGQKSLYRMGYRKNQF